MKFLTHQRITPVIEASVVSRAEDSVEEESEETVARRLFDDSDDESEEEDFAERRNASNTRPTAEIDLAELETRAIAFKIIGRIGYNSPEYNTNLNQLS